MSNCVFGTPIYSDVGSVYTPTFSGGSWVAGLPLTNLQDRRLSKVARSTDDANASTKFDVDLGVARACRMVVLCAHNLSLAALIRITGSNASDMTSPVYAGGWVAAYDSSVTAEMVADAYHNWDSSVIFAANQTARYWRVEINDTTNVDTYVEIGRLVIAAGYQPTINMSNGVKLGLTSASTATETEGGANVYNERRRRRTMIGIMEHLPESEALVSPFENQWRLGTTKQLYFIYDPADTTHRHRRQFLAVFKELSAIEFPFYNYAGSPFSLTEEL